MNYSIINYYIKTLSDILFRNCSNNNLLLWFYSFNNNLFYCIFDKMFYDVSQPYETINAVEYIVNIW